MISLNMKTNRIIAILALTLAMGCSKEDTSGWYLDTSYSDLLVSYSEEVPVIVTQHPAHTVDVLQIFRSNRGKDSLDTVTGIRSKLLVYETRRREDILALFRAMKINTKERCDSPDGDFTFSVLAYDRALMRVGVVQYFPCKRIDLGWIQTPGSNSVSFSSETAKIMNKIIPPSIQRSAR